MPEGTAMGYEALADVLEEERQVCSALCQVSERLHDAVVSGDVDAVDRCVTEAQSLLMKVNSLNQRREACIGEIAGAAGSGTVSLPEIIRGAGEPHRSRLEAIMREIQIILRKHRSINQVNEKLLRARLNVIRELREAMEKASGSMGGAPGLDKTV